MTHLPVNDAEEQGVARAKAPRSATGINWRLWAVLFGGGMLGALAIIPYSLQIVKAMPLPAEQPPMPLGLILALSLVQNAVLLGLAIWGGLHLARRTGLKGAPLLEAWLTGSKPDGRRELLSGAMTGLLAGALMVCADLAFFARALPSSLLTLLDVPLWQRLSAGILYGGINEELLMRLFLVSFLVWLIGLFFKRADGRPVAAVAFIAVTLAAVVFGLGHLPATAALTPLTAELIVRALVLNFIAGMAFGLLYIKWGLESAMLGHAAAHLILQIPGAWLVLAASQHLS